MGVSVLPPLALMPLGTGNELSRRLGWGEAYSPRKPISSILEQVRAAPVVPVDQWTVGFVETAGEATPGSSREVKMSCFLSVGFDAFIAHQFHLKREANPGKPRSRAANKLWHVWFGLGVTFKKQPVLSHSIRLFIDGAPVPIPDTIRCIHVLNIRTTGDGLDLFRDSHTPTKRDLLAGQVRHSYADGVVEVVGTEGPLHLVKLRVARGSHALRLGQGREVRLEMQEREDGKPFPMQVEGEPFLQPPSVVTIKNPVHRMFLRGPRDADDDPVARALVKPNDEEEEQDEKEVEGN